MSSKNPRKTRSFGSGKKDVKKFQTGGPIRPSAIPRGPLTGSMSVGPGYMTRQQIQQYNKEIQRISDRLARQGYFDPVTTKVPVSALGRFGKLALRGVPYVGAALTAYELAQLAMDQYNKSKQEQPPAAPPPSNNNVVYNSPSVPGFQTGYGSVPAGTPGSGDSLNAIRDAQSAAAVQQLRDAANARAMAAQQAAAAKKAYVIPEDLAGNPLPTFDQPGSGSSGSSSGSGFRGPSSSAFSYGSRLPAVNPPPSITPDSRVTVAPISSGEEDMDVDPIYRPDAMEELGLYRGGRARSVKRYASGGSVRSSASKRGDGIARKGKTRGKFVR